MDTQQAQDLQQKQQQPQSANDVSVCPLHSGKKCIFICTDQTNTDLVFKCEVCVIDQTLNIKNMLLIEQILESNSKTVFRHWPLPQNSQLIEKVRELSFLPKSDGKYREDIDKYFKKLRVEVNEQIDDVQVKMKQKAEKLWDYYECILQEYSNLSAKEDLKKALIEETVGIEDKSVKVKEIIEKVLKNQNEAKEKLESCFAQLALQESAIDFETPKQIQTEVLQKLAQIDMFLTQDIQDLNIQQKQQLVQEDKIEADGNLKYILKLVSSRLNNTSQTFQEKMKVQMQRLRKIIEKFDLGDIGEESKWVTDLELLDEQDIQQTKSFLSALIQRKIRNDRAENQNSIKVSDILSLISNKCNFISEEFLSSTKKMLEGISQYVETFEVVNIYQDGQNQEQFDNLSKEQLSRGIDALKELKGLLSEDERSQQSLREVINVGQQLIRAKNMIQQPERAAQKQAQLSSEIVLQLVSNQSNLCSQEMLNQLSTAFKAIPLYLSSFTVSEEQLDPITWQGLDLNQIATLGKLGNKIRELNEQSKGSFQAISTINQNQLPKSWSIMQLARQSYLLIAKDINQVEELLLKYPILELADSEFKWNQILLWQFTSIFQWQFTMSNLWTNSEMNISNSSEGVQISTYQKTGLIQTAFSQQTLDVDIVYTFTCTFSRPLSGSHCVSICLIEEPKVQSTHIYSNNYFSSYPGNGGKIVIKGQLVNTSPINETMTQMQFMFCIGQQAFFYADSTLNNINQVDPKLINKKGKYRVGISISNQTRLTVKLSNLIAIFDQKQEKQGSKL